jgi:hypothetical protein
MPFSKKLAQRIRESLSHLNTVEEQQKMGGISFMVDGKMCVRAHTDNDMMLRCDPVMTEELLLKKGAKRFEMRGRTTMKGWLVISEEGIKNKKDFDYWISIALDYNKHAKISKKK